MAYGNGKVKTNGSGLRKLDSWIASFEEQTAGLDSPLIFRRWSAIAAIASVLEQKVWIRTTRPLYPNLYTLIVGHPGVGKTRTIREAKSYVSGLPDFHLAPISLSFASLVDSLTQAKRMVVRLPDAPLEYNSMFIAVDELGAFIHKYDDEMVAGLSAFYDPDPYSQTRRTRDINIKIKSPQLNILAGSTPSNLLKFMPEGAWEQGFTSRLIMIFSDERIIGDDFATTSTNHSSALEHDIRIINHLCGEFEVTPDYRNAVNNWRALGEVPVPSHPKLIHYVTRRRTHLYKLSMISAVDRSNVLILTKDDFNRAMGWLIEAEEAMLEIFKAGSGSADAQALDEIKYFIQTTDRGQGVAEQRIINFARERIPLHSVLRVIEIMQGSGMIRGVAVDKKTGQRLFRIHAAED
jgi:hypothetical protein